MQKELDEDYPLLDIEILGVNERGHEVGNEGVSAGRDIPWLQDLDGDGNGSSDMWEEWGITFRDVVILNKDNEQVGVFNLSEYDLGQPQNYEALRSQMVAATVPEPSAMMLLVVGMSAVLFVRARR